MLRGWQRLVGKEKGNPGQLVSPGLADGHRLTLMTPGMFYPPLWAVGARKIQTNNTKGKGHADKENMVSRQEAAGSGGRAG